MKTMFMSTSSSLSSSSARSFLVVAVSVITLLGGCNSKKEAPPPAPTVAPAPPVAPPPAPVPPPPAAVGGVTLGKAIGGDKKVAAAATTFGPKDTIYASIETTGVCKATVLKAKWSFTDKKGKVIPVNEESLTADLDGPATHEFHINKKSPWPKGAYDVEVFLGDKSVAKAPFSIN